MKIVYTLTDEAPALATQSLLPVLRAFAAAADIDVESRDISLAGRILAQFPERLGPDERVADALRELGELAKTPEANIIKLPNISASVPQLKAAIAELQGKGYGIPDYPDEPSDEEQRDARARYDRVKGSAVNPVLREGNSDRRAPASVKAYARRHPHSMGAWSPSSRSQVSTMTDGDFRSTEQSVTVERGGPVRIEHVAADGTVTVLKERIPVAPGEVLDAAVMRAKSLDEFLAAQIAEAKEAGVLFSVHLKATMMKVSDPIMFGHAVRVYFADLFAEHGAALASVGVNANDGLAALLSASEKLPEDERSAVHAAIEAAYANGPALAMVDSDRGVTNLHAPSDVIIDASMPAAIRSSGQMWNAAGELQDTRFTIPDHSYAALYAETVNHCREHGAFDPATMGTTPNVGLMAQAAEEYGSHDTTFEITSGGTVRVVTDGSDAPLLEHVVDAGDIWRLCRTTDAAIKDWARLAAGRAGETGVPAVFWLDEDRPHDAELLRKVRRALAELGTDDGAQAGLQIEIMDVAAATRFTLERARSGEDTISVTGNVLRDYLTDLFPILELGTSAKVLSIVPLMDGGGLFETGAGGSAPRHVQQFLKENHLRWDSLGEFLALVPALELLAEKTDNPRAKLLAETLDRATARARGASISLTQSRRARQPRQPLLPRPLLGEGASRADRGPGPRGAFRAAGRHARRERGDDRRGAELRPGGTRRHRRLLPAGPRARRGGDASERDLEQRARELLISPARAKPSSPAPKRLVTRSALRRIACGARQRRPKESYAFGADCGRGGSRIADLSPGGARRRERSVDAQRRWFRVGDGGAGRGVAVADGRSHGADVASRAVGGEPEGRRRRRRGPDGGRARVRIQTDSIDVSRGTVRVGPRKHRHSVRRYVATESLAITTTAAIVGHVIDVAVATGADSINGPSFSFSDPTAGTLAATNAALADARRRANAAAATLGYTVTGVQSVNLDPQPAIVAPVNGSSGTPAASAPPTPTTIHPGTQQVDATVVVVYTIAPA